MGTGRAGQAEGGSGGSGGQSNLRGWLGIGEARTTPGEERDRLGAAEPEGAVRTVRHTAKAPDAGASLTTLTGGRNKGGGDRRENEGLGHGAGQAGLEEATEEERAVASLADKPSEEGRLLTINMDGRWDEERLDDVVRVSVGGGGPRGVVCLQDVRWPAEKVKGHLARLSWRWDQGSGCESRWVHAAAPHEGEDAAFKCMGGNVIGVWGDLSRMVVHPGPAQDPLGRWAVVWLRGRQCGGVAIFSVYRPPSGSESGLVGRQRVALGLTSLTATQAAFYRDLGRAVEEARDNGLEVVLAGDWNADPRRNDAVGKAQAKWCLLQRLQPPGGVGQTAATYTYSGAGGTTGSSCIDHIFSSSPTLLEPTAPPVQVGLGPWGHLLLASEWSAALRGLLNLEPDARHRLAEWRAGSRAMGRAMLKRLNIVEKKTGDAFRAHCVLPENIEGQLSTIEDLAKWCADWWACPEELVEVVPKRLKKAALAGDSGTMARSFRGHRKPHTLRSVVRRKDGSEARGGRRRYRGRLPSILWRPSAD